MQRNRLFAISVTLLVLTGCAKIRVVHLEPASENGKKPTANGVFYALPKTVVRVAMTVEKTERTGAPFAEYAAIFAPGGNPVCKTFDCCKEAVLTYELKTGATMSTFGTPDPNNVYMVEFTGGGAVDQALNLAWTDMGLLSSASVSVTNRTTDVVVSTLKLAAGAATRIWLSKGFSKGENGRRVCVGSPSPNDDYFLRVLEADPKLGRTLVANYCGLPKDDRDKLEYEPEKLQEAVSTYKLQVADLVDNRDAILGGLEVNEPVELVNKLEGMIAAKLQSFYLGSQKTTAWNVTVDVEPKKNSDGSSNASKQLLAIDKYKGVCVPAGVKPAPTSETSPDNFIILTGDDCKKAEVVSLALEYYPKVEEQEFWLVSTRTKAPTDERSFRYRIPGQVTADVNYCDGSYGKAVLSVAQFGEIASLPAKRNSKSLSFDLGMVEATGALKSFKLGTTGGLESETIDALGGISSDVLDARNKAIAAKKEAREKEAEAQSQLIKLKNQADILEQLDRICTIQTKYGLPCTAKP